ncbi:thioredoxin domain-containing protein [Sinomonas terrae]|uniref:Thioredoxin domain-containing protein n=1 Tax=Sinomonas terrae TaxID=2908838 RepID=A0ABS9U363_9MICC|nr:thioredoxin domain-containing protein [Sinomonas terrae]MCH6471138.1 thioredoxin domain-containing protein [Sinomonas terrae]
MANRLAGSPSAYLRQHAANPVDWQHYGDEALAEAARRGVPVFISIGYAACHWCHVMAHESFEDRATAEVLNERFVSIKVDREERPDVDAVYMAACQAMSGQGGWPLSIFALPDGRAFYAGTYFPPLPYPGRPSFRQILDAVWEAWTERREAVEQQAAALAEGLGGVFSAHLLDVKAPALAVESQALDDAVAALVRGEDPENGGFGGAPKFPPSPVLEFLIRHASAASSGGGTAEAARAVAGRTLAGMCRSALFDALGGGFARYSVTADWSLPHYEKMLYDNAQLLRVLAHWVWLGGSDEFPRDEAHHAAVLTAEWLVRELGLPEGGFASSLDADSERDGRSVEGGYYVWTRRELAEALGQENAADAARLAAVFGLPMGEHSDHAGPLHAGRALDTAERELLERHRAALVVARARRTPPGRDDKVVAGWNGLAVAALADAAWALERPELLDAAQRAAELLATVHWDGERLLRVSHAGSGAGIEGLLADYAGCAEGAFSLYAATGEERWYAWAEELLEAATQRFVADGLLSDEAVAPREASAGVRSALAGARTLDPHDTETPSGASLLAGVLLTHAAYSGSLEDRALASSILAGLPRVLAQGPRVAGWLLAVGEASLAGPLEIAVVGRPGENRRRLLAAALAAPSAGRVVAVADAEAADGKVPLLADRPSGPDGSPLAYVCRDFACRLPVGTPEELGEQLRAGG